MQLYPFQQEVLDQTKDQNKVAYYLDMGLGKTFVGSEKMMQLCTKVNLVVCQKSKIDDWVNHFVEQYELDEHMMIYDCSKWKKGDWESMKNDVMFESDCHKQSVTVLVINYELAFRRKELLNLKDFTVMLDESSLIQNESAKRTKFIMKLNFENLILLSGTPTSGKYENLWSQMHLLDWSISKDLYWNQYIDFHYQDNEGFPILIVDGYKNVERLKQKMRDHGCVFMKSEEVFDLPEQIFNKIHINTTKNYRKFRKDSIVIVNDRELVGDTTLTKMLYERMLCGQYNEEKLQAFKDLLNSTEDRLIVFYNFNEELRAIEDICIELDKPLSIVNGQEKDLTCYNEFENSVTAIQYQAGSMGLNLQKSNKIIYFTPTLSSELFEQSKKRIHRIGQNSNCSYYELICKNSIEENIYATLAMRKDYTDKLFKKDL
jgi:SNF2 family DNA or RNA helicase